jgi:hypothetical protein
MTGKAIYAILSAASAVTNLVSTRIYPEMATQKAAYPFLVYTISGTAPSDTKDGVSGLDVVEFSVMSYATTYDAVNTIAAAVRTALDRTSGTHGTVNVQSIRFQDQRSSEMDWDKNIFIIEQAYSARIIR